MKSELTALQKRIEECCSAIDAADKVAVETAKRLDRVQATTGDFRREMRARLKELRIRVEALERLQRPTS